MTTLPFSNSRTKIRIIDKFNLHTRVIKLFLYILNLQKDIRPLCEIMASKRITRIFLTFAHHNRILKKMDIIIKAGVTSDIDELEQLYDDLNDHLSTTTNHPGWIKGIYPTRKNAEEGIASKTLHVAKFEEKIVGSIILNHEPEAAYNNAPWQIEIPYNNIFVIHTLVVHPHFLKFGIGKQLISFALEFGKKSHMKAIRLDVYEQNTPAIRLYEKNGFQYITTVDL